MTPPTEKREPPNIYLTKQDCELLDTWSCRECSVFRTRRSDDWVLYVSAERIRELASFLGNRILELTQAQADIPKQDDKITFREVRYEVLRIKQRLESLIGTEE